MRTAFSHYVLAVMIAGLIALAPINATAAVNLPWSTTFNCPEWKQSDGLYPPAINCDGLTGYGAWTTSDGEEEQITAAANYPGGAGGRGQRHWLGDGSANNSGGTRIEWASGESEIWIRWYMRYQIGFTWSLLAQNKVLYLNVGSANSVILGPTEWDRIYMQTQCAPQNYPSPVGTGWDSILAAGGALDSNGHRRSDGQWHLHEIHLKADTNGSNGVAEWWIDGTQIMSYSNANFCGGQWSYLVIGENHAYSSNGGSAYVDYDDIAIRTTGPIGPVGPADTTPPTAPTNLTVQ